MIKISFRINKLNPQAPEYSMVNSCRHLNVTGSGCVPGLLIAGAKDSVDDELEEQNATRDIENCVPGFKSRLEINQSLVRFHVRIIPKQI